MKRTIPLLILICFSIAAHAQNIIRARFMLSEHCDNFQVIELTLDSKVKIGISGDGVLQYATTLRGRDLRTDDLEKRGIVIKYYDKFDLHDIPGRVKSIGDIKVAYNNTFDIHEVRGSIKVVGDIAVKYYNTFDINDPSGKVKSVGDVKVLYNNSFDTGKEFGVLKSIKGNTRELEVVEGW